MAMCDEIIKKQQQEIVLQPFNYIHSTPGKNIRPLFFKAMNQWLQIPTEKLNIISDAIQMLHNASLVLDDIEDNSVLRRGKPVAHLVYGIPLAMNSAHYIFGFALKKLLKLNHQEVGSLYVEELGNLFIGQHMDLHWRDNCICPTEEEYKGMVVGKTGSLFILGMRLMLLFTEEKRDFRPFLETFSEYFQVRDDYANLFSNEYEEQKSFAEDLTEGKFSFPLIHAVRQSTGSVRDKIMSIVKQKTTDVSLKKYCVQLLVETGSAEYTRKYLLQLEKRLHDMLNSFGGHPALELVLEKLAIHKIESSNIQQNSNTLQATRTVKDSYTQQISYTDKHSNNEDICHIHQKLLGGETVG